MIKIRLFLVAVLFLGTLAGCQSVSAAAGVNTAKSSHVRAQQKVTVYGISGCLMCLRTKWFLSTHHIPYTFYNVQYSPQGRELYRAQNAPGVPIITVGKNQIIGYDKAQLITLLRKAGYR